MKYIFIILLKLVLKLDDKRNKNKINNKFHTTSSNVQNQSTLMCHLEVCKTEDEAAIWDPSTLFHRYTQITLI